MAQQSSTQSNLDIKFLTLMISQQGNFFIGRITTIERHEMFNKIPCFSSTIGLLTDLITVISPSDHQIPFHSTQSDFNGRLGFMAQNAQSYNVRATRLANSMDNKHTHCIVGDCAFVFDTNTNFTEDILHRLTSEISH